MAMALAATSSFASRVKTLTRNKTKHAQQVLRAWLGLSLTVGSIFRYTMVTRVVMIVAGRNLIT